MSITTAQAIHDVLAQAMSDDSDVVLLGEAVGRAGGLAGTTKGLLEAHGPTRVFDLPVADRGTLGLAMGMALAGKRPVVELSSSGRLLAGIEVLAEAATLSLRGTPVPMVVRVPCGGQAGERVDRPVAELLASVDGLSVVCPSSTASAAGLLRGALQGRGPVVVLESRSLYRARGDAPAHAQDLRAAVPVRAGDHVLLASWGSGVSAALRAAEQLQADGLSAAVLDLVSLSPLDAQALGEWVRSTGRLVCVEAPEGGLSTRVLSAALDQAFLYLEAPLASATASAEGVAEAARRAIDY